MFGLMRAKKCGMSAAEKHFRRLNYCGTCKTIGSLYGQKSRLLLNHDAVFLAELLSALSGENVEHWQKSYQSFNCLNLPKSAMLPALQFAATTNIILTEFKLADHAADEGKRRYKFAQKAFSKEFGKAEKMLKEWDFPLRKVKAILNTQTSRESEIQEKNTDLILMNLAAPTAEITAIFFREGVRQISRNEYQNLAYSLGFSFGKLTYLLDAFEDYEKDFRTNQFNAIRAAFRLNDNKISSPAKRKTVSILRELKKEIIEKIEQFPVAENQKTLFVLRLSNNLERKLKTNLPIARAKKVCAPKPKQSFSQRWTAAKKTARNLAGNYSWQMPLVFLFILVFALVAPAQSREAKSARECFDLSFNLMFLGAIFGSVLAFPKSISAQNPQELLAEEKRKKTTQNADGGDSGDSSSWCDYCDCGDCGCCDSCDCCSGCCDNCDCCSCD